MLRKICFYHANLYVLKFYFILKKKGKCNLNKKKKKKKRKLTFYLRTGGLVGGFNFFFYINNFSNTRKTFCFL